MATATNTTLGEIRLAGDLAGSNNGLAPALTNTGVTPGSYSLPSLTVDAKGRITSIASTPLSSVIPTATTSSLGLVKPDNTTITIDGTGTLTSILPPATSSTLGVVRANDGSISITAGVISAVTATSSNRGIVRPDGTTTTVDGTGIISAVIPIGTAGTPGIVRPDGTTIVMGAGAGVLTATGLIAPATTAAIGAVRPDGTTITIDGSGIISAVIPTGTVPTATSSTLGLVRPDNTTMTVSSGVLSAVFPDATSTTLGKVRPDNTTMTVSSGVLSAVIPTATTSTLGAVRPDNSSITVNGSGVLSVAASIPKLSTSNTFSGTQSVTPNVITTTSGTTTVTGNESNVYNLVANNMPASNSVTLAKSGNWSVGAQYTVVIDYSAATTFTNSFNIFGTGVTPTSNAFYILRFIATGTTTVKNLGQWIV